MKTGFFYPAFVPGPRKLGTGGTRNLFQALAAERWGNYPAVLAITVVVVSLAVAGLAMVGHEAKGAEMSEA